LDEDYELKVATCAAYDVEPEVKRDTAAKCKWTANSCATTVSKPTTCKYSCTDDPRDVFLNRLTGGRKATHKEFKDVNVVVSGDYVAARLAAMDAATYASCEVANRMLRKRSDLTEEQRRALADETVDRVYQHSTRCRYCEI
jgi:hypothetical protein